jgi:hypothetical protein
MVRRANLGEAFPWSKATKETVAGGGTSRSKVGYTLLKKYCWTESRDTGTLGISSGDTPGRPELDIMVGAGPAASAKPLLAANSAGEAGAGMKPGLTGAGNWLVWGVNPPGPYREAAAEGSALR